MGDTTTYTYIRDRGGHGRYNYLQQGSRYIARWVSGFYRLPNRDLFFFSLHFLIFFINCKMLNKYTPIVCVCGIAKNRLKIWRFKIAAQFQKCTEKKKRGRGRAEINF